MARKEKKERAAGEESAGSKLVTALIAIIIVLIWLAVFAFLIKLDVGGMGSNVLYPVLKDVPVINKILPEVSEEQQALEGNYKYNTLKSANARIDELEKRLESEGASTADADYIAELEARIEKLQRYKDEQDAFEQRVREFDENVVYNGNAPDIEEYRQYYEDIAPENAERIYRQVVSDLQDQARIEKLVKRYESMDAASAAKVLSEMPEDLDTICAILENMKDSSAAEIMQNFDSLFAAQITKKMAISN